MKTLLVFIFLFLCALIAKAQSSSKIANILNTDTGVNPPNLTYSDGLPEGLWRKTATTNLRLGQNQIYGLLDSLSNMKTAMQLKYSSSNPSNYISGITSAMVVASMGFMPYDGNANPNNYLPNSRTITINGVTQDLSANRTFTVTNTQVNSDWNSVSGASQILNKPTLFDGAYSSLTGKPTLFSGTYSDLTGKPALFSGSYADLTNKPTIPAQINLTAGNGISITGTYPNITVSMVAPTISIASRSLNTNFTISSTKTATVSYTVTCSSTNPLLVGTSSATAFLEYSLNAGTTWLNPSQSGNSNGVGIAVAVALTNGQTGVVSGTIPANALVRIRTVVAGTATISYATGQEVTY